MLNKIKAKFSIIRKIELCKATTMSMKTYDKILTLNVTLLLNLLES